MKNKIYAKRDALAEIRKQRGLNQKEFAERLGVNYQWYNQVERETKALSLKRANSLLEQLDGIEFEDIFRRNSELTSLPLSEDHLEELERVARNKNTTPNQVAKELLEAHLEDRSSVGYPFSSQMLPDWDAVTKKALHMLEGTTGKWWATGILASWIKRPELGKAFKDRLAKALKEGRDIRILINSAPEVLVPTETQIGGENSGKQGAAKPSEIEGKAKSKVRSIMKAYYDKLEPDPEGNKNGEDIVDKDKIRKMIRWFPHGDIRTFLTEEEGEADPQYQLILAVATPDLAGGDQPRSYTGIYLKEVALIREYKKRFETLWEYAKEVPDEVEADG